MGIIVPSFPVQNFVPSPYQGDLTAVNVWLLTGGVVTRPLDNGGLQTLSQGHQSKVVQTVFNWSTQFPSQAVSINFQNNNNANANLLDKIVMVYINNANNIDDVTVYFPDSGMFVTSPAGSAAYYPVFTNLWIAYVYNGTSGQANTNNLAQQTQILFCNFAVPGFLAQTQDKVFQAVDVVNTVTAVFQQIQVLPQGNYEIYGFELFTNYGVASAAGFCTTILTLAYGVPPASGQVLSNCVASGVASAAGIFPFYSPVTRMSFPNPIAVGTSPNDQVFVQCNTLGNLSQVNFVCNLWYNTLSI